MENYIDDSRIHEGHRGRMRSKLLSHGQRIFDTYELLEMLLYQVVPYKDTNPISKRLLAAFGGLDGVLSASKEELTKVNGVGDRTADFIISVGKLYDIIGAEIIPESPIDFSDYEAVGEYLVNYFFRVEKKCVVALFLDSSMRLISIKKLYDLDFESAGVRAKAFIDEAVKTRATVVISAHNNPFGSTFPTQGDRATNGMITDALTMAGFVHAEHYIVSGSNYSGIGSLKEFASKLSQMPAVSQFIETRDKINGATCQASTASNDLINLCGSEISGYNKEDLEYFASLLLPCAGKYAMKYAEILLQKYRTIENVFTASAGELVSMLNDKCAFCLKLLAYITSRRKTDKFSFGQKHSKAEIADYLKALYLGEAVEKIYVICFNAEGRIIGCEMISEGTVNSSEIMPRKAVEIAIGMSAKTVALAHNHPFGTTRASSDDVNLTKHMVSVFSSCEIGLTDHYIVAGQLCDIIIF